MSGETSVGEVSVSDETSVDEVSVSDKTSVEEVNVSDEASVDEVSVSDEISADEVSVSDEASADEVIVSDEASVDEVSVSDEASVDEVRVSDEASKVFDEEVYEGAVRLDVESDGDIQLVVSFVQELRLNAQFRVLRLVSHSQTDMEISLGLREPLRLKQILGEIEGVSQVSPAEGPRTQVKERLLNVRLAG